MAAADNVGKISHIHVTFCLQSKRLSILCALLSILFEMTLKQLSAITVALSYNGNNGFNFETLKVCSKMNDVIKTAN